MEPAKPTDVGSEHMATDTKPSEPTDIDEHMGTDSVQEGTDSDDEFLCKACDDIPVYSYHWFPTRQWSRPLPWKRCKCFGCEYCQAPFDRFCLNCPTTTCCCDCMGCEDYDYEISSDE